MTMRSSKLFKLILHFKLSFFILIFAFLIFPITHAAGVIEDAPRLAELLTNILNFLLQIFGIIAILSLVISGVIYLTAAGDEDKIKLAKRSSLYSIIGIAVALSGIIVIKTIEGSLK